MSINPVYCIFSANIKVTNKDGDHELHYEVVINKGSTHIEFQNYISGPYLGKTIRPNVVVDFKSKEMNNLLNSFTDQVINLVHEGTGQSIDEIFEINSHGKEEIDSNIHDIKNYQEEGRWSANDI
jgi:hypothetical protein